MEPGNKAYVYVRLTDKAGNMSIINSDGVVVYTDAAQVTTELTYTKTTKTDAIAEVNLNGNTIDEVAICTAGGSGSETEPEVLTKDTDYTLNKAGNQITLKGTYLDTLSAGEYTITVSYAPMGEKYKTNMEDETDSNDAPTDTTISLKVERTEGSVTDIADLSKVFDGEAVETPAFTTTNEKTDTSVKAEYKLAGAEDDTYTTTAPKDAGSYMVRITVAADGTYKEASATQAFTISQADAPDVAEVKKDYFYQAGSRNETVTVDIAALLPEDRGDTTYELEANTAEYVTDKEVADGKLTYKVSAQTSAGAATTLIVTAKSKNYKAITVNVVITLVEQYVTVESEDAKVAITGSNKLTYGQKLSELTLNTEEAVFVVDGDPDTKVTGTLAWTNPDAVLDAGTKVAEWTFTPDEPENYTTLTGKVAITVEKASPDVKALPTVTARIYHPTVALKNSDLTGGEVESVSGTALTGTWSWENTDVVPTVGNSGYTAVFTPTGTDKANYKTITETIAVPVTKATPYIETAPTASAITYGDMLSASTLTDGSVQYSSTDNTAVEGTFAWEVDTTKPAYTDSNKTEYKVVFTPEDKNYNTVETDMTVTVNKAPSAPNKPNNTMEVDYTKEKVSDITTLPEGWAWKDADKDKALTVGTPETATAVYTGEDKGNYEIESVEISITRQECTHATTELRNAVAATCTVKGYTGDTCCTVCDKVITYGEDINALGHDMKKTISAKVEATCTTAGQEAVMGCSRCDYTEGGATINALGHSFADTFTTDKEATCTEAGSKSKHCSRCDAKTEVTAIPAKGHTWDAGTVTKPATCIEKGVKTFACTVAGCDGTKTEDIAINPNNHTFDTKWTYDDTCHWHAATCEHEEETADKAEHTFGDWVTVTEATEDAEGLKERSCVCGYKETDKLEKLTHTHVKDKGTRVEPTCEKNGSITYKCTKCDEVMDVVELAATGHKWDAGTVTKEPTETTEGEKTYTCTVCGKTNTEVIPKKEAAAPEQPKKGDVIQDDKGAAKYEILDTTKKEAAYKAPVNQKAKTVTIPATVEIDGVTYKVTKIADNAFKGNKTVTKVTIGSNIKTIGKNAFSGATKLKKVSIGKNVTEIEANAFKGCSSLTSITLPSNVTKIGANAFNGCKKLKTLTIKSTKLTSKTVAKNAFKGLTKETTIKVPKKKLEAYKKLFKSRGLSSKVTVKGY